VLSHLLSENLLEDGFDAFSDASFYLSLHGSFELFLLGQVPLLPHSTHKIPDVIFESASRLLFFSLVYR
jgi:hypothetical protein